MVGKPISLHVNELYVSVYAYNYESDVFICSDQLTDACDWSLLPNLSCPIGRFRVGVSDF